MATSLYKVLFVIFVFIHLLFDSVEVLVISSGFLLTLIVFDRRTKLSKSIFILLSYLGALTIIGLISSVFYSYELFDRIKDVIYFVKPILLILLGYLLVKRIKNTTFVLKAIVYIAFFFAIKHLIVLATADMNGTVEDLRLRGGANNFIELVALVILAAYKKKDAILKYDMRIIMLIIIGASFMLYLSRTMILGLVIVLLSVYGYTKLSRKVVEYASLAFIVFGLFYAYLFTLDLRIDKPGFQNFLFKIRNSPGEVFSAPKKYDPRNHREIFVHWRGYEANVALNQMRGNPANYVIGKGFGALVDLGFKAPIGGDDGLRYIPYLHNGYVYVFFKTGAIGLLLYLVLLINIYRQIYIKTKSKKEKILRSIVSGLGIYFFMASLVISGMYNLEEISVFCLGIFYALVQLEAEKNKKEIHE